MRTFTVAAKRGVLAAARRAIEVAFDAAASWIATPGVATPGVTTPGSNARQDFVGYLDIVKRFVQALVEHDGA
jgi:hypothetical protein